MVNRCHAIVPLHELAVDNLTCLKLEDQVKWDPARQDNEVGEEKTG